MYQYVYYILLCVIQYTVLFSTESSTLNCLVFVSALATKLTLASSLSLSRTRYIVRCGALKIFLNLVFDLCYWACIKYFILDIYTGAEARTSLGGPWPPQKNFKHFKYFFFFRLGTYGPDKKEFRPPQKI
jgi:hypothetical protein